MIMYMPLSWKGRRSLWALVAAGFREAEEAVGTKRGGLKPGEGVILYSLILLTATAWWRKGKWGGGKGLFLFSRQAERGAGLTCQVTSKTARRRLALLSLANLAPFAFTCTQVTLAYLHLRQAFSFARGKAGRSFR